MPVVVVDGFGAGLFTVRSSSLGASLSSLFTTGGTCKSSFENSKLRANEFMLPKYLLGVLFSSECDFRFAKCFFFLSSSSFSMATVSCLFARSEKPYPSTPMCQELGQPHPVGHGLCPRLLPFDGGLLYMELLDDCVAPVQGRPPPWPGLLAPGTTGPGSSRPAAQCPSCPHSLGSSTTSASLSCKLVGGGS